MCFVCCYRERRSTLPPLPQTRAALIIPPEYRNTLAGDRFFLYGHPQGDFIIFATDANLRLLCSSRIISMDGTFDVVPRLFLQLFTLHTFRCGRLLPLVYVLMSQKTTNQYCRVFQEITNACQNINENFDPPKIMSDFESGLISAVSQFFPATTHKGCLFHLCQVRLCYIILI